MGNASFVIVSHSKKLADGLIQLASQMAGPSVHMVPAAGLGDELGTSATDIVSAMETCPEDGAILLFFDLGSAYMNCQMALELSPPAIRDRSWIVDSPLVEGVIASSVVASMGLSQEEVIAAAEEAYHIRKVAE